MASSFYRPAPGGRGVSPWRRSGALALAIAAHILLIWLLLRLAPTPKPPPESPALSTFALDADKPAAPAAARATRAAVAKAAAASASARPVPPPLPVPSQTKTEWPEMMSESFDLAAVPKSGKAQGESARGDQGTRGDSVAVYGPGAGPGGERLYDADWMREPTSGEINGYLKSAPPPDAWALIACKTIPDNRVDNCRVLGESPIGSGLGSQMRQAAWQFRILPPRRGGTPIIGAWVSIRISWTRGTARAG